MGLTRTNLIMIATLLAAIIWPVGSDGVAMAGEMVRSGGRVRTEVVQDDDVEPVPQVSSETNALQLVIDGAVYQSKYRTKIPTLKQAYASACYSDRGLHRRSICRAWPSVGRSFDAAGKVMGLPSPALVCIMKAESNFVPGLTSGVGASGLMQFMPDTAYRYQRLMMRSPEYQAKWRAYRSAFGTDRGVENFTARNIRSSDPRTADVQIFAAAMYIRESMRGYESAIKRSLGPPPEPQGVSLKRLMHFWLASYNAGGVPGGQYLRELQRGGRNAEARAESVLPYETREYLRKFDSCYVKAIRTQR